MTLPTRLKEGITKSNVKKYDKNIKGRQAPPPKQFKKKT